MEMSPHEGNGRDGAPGPLKNVGCKNDGREEGGVVCLVVGGLLLGLTGLTTPSWKFLLVTFGFLFIGLVQANSSCQRIAGIVLSGLAGAACLVLYLQARCTTCS